MLRLLCWSSDPFRERSLHLAAALVLTLVGYVILIAVDGDGAQNRALAYFGVFFFFFSCVVGHLRLRRCLIVGMRITFSGRVLGPRLLG